jgi:hypothetical protein
MDAINEQMRQRGGRHRKRGDVDATLALDHHRVG